jgi:hypothetical protein
MLGLAMYAAVRARAKRPTFTTFSFSIGILL